MTSPDPEPVKNESAQISLKVVGADQQETYFKIKRSTPLHKLFGAYAKKTGVNRTQIRFIYDGNPLEDNATPDQLDMDDDDVIDAMVEQVGGF